MFKYKYACYMANDLSLNCKSLSWREISARIANQGAQLEIRMCLSQEAAQRSVIPIDLILGAPRYVHPSAN